MFKDKKTDILIIIFAAVLLLIIVVIVVFSLRPSPTPTAIVQVTPSPTNTIDESIPSTDPPVEYSAEESEKLISKLKNRTQLSPGDQAAKNQLLTLLPSGQQSGVIYQTDNFIVDYTVGPDVFQVEILNKNINQAKQEAVSWLVSQGVSPEGVCNYPVQFYLNYEVAESLRSQSVEFSPLAPGC